MGMNSVSTVALTSNHAVKGNGIKFKISKKYDCQEEEMEDKKKSQKQIEQLRSYLKKGYSDSYSIWEDEVEEDKKKTDEDDIAQK